MLKAIKQHPKIFMNFTLGDHLKTSALLSSRHALYAGGGYVIENTAEGVRHLSLEDFAEDKELKLYRMTKDALAVAIAWSGLYRV